MLNCQSCQTRLVLYSSQLDNSLQQLQAVLGEDSDGVIPDFIKADFLLQKQLKTINPDVYIVPDGTTPNSTAMATPLQGAGEGDSGSKVTPNPTTPPPPPPLNSNTYYHTSNLLIPGTLTAQTESNQSLVPDDGSMGFAVIEQRITKVSRLLSLLTNLTLIHHPLCPKCCHDLNMRLSRYCQQLDTELQSILTTELDLVQIAFGNQLRTTIAQYQSQPLDQCIESILNKQQFQQQQQSNYTTQLVQSLTADELLNRQLTSLYNEEQHLRDEMGALEYEMWQLQQEEEELEQFSSYLSQLEDNFMSTLLDMKQSISQYLLLNRAIKGKLDQQQTIHNALSLTSPLFDLMTIDLQSPIPSISGFRLGRSDDCHVDWFEINAAFGQICLLLDILRRTFDLTFKDDIQLYPLGHRSYISYRGTILPMYKESTDSAHTGHFAEGCKTMLRCIQQLYESQMSITPIPSTIVATSGVQQSQTRNADDGTASGTSSPSLANSNSSGTRRTNQRDQGPGYQPHLQYQHEGKSGNGADSGGKLFQQPQYDTAKYAQMIAGGGVAVIPAMTSQIQPPYIVLGDDGNENPKGKEGGGGVTGAIIASSIKIASLPGVSLSSHAPPPLFVCSINGCELNPDEQVVWVNSMRQLLMALFQLMLLAVQRGI